jgi:hypothetical protein
MVAMLIFAPQATDAGGFEDYARKMYPEFTRLNLPTWIIGPAWGAGPLMDRLAEILQIWSTICGASPFIGFSFHRCIENVIHRCDNLANNSSRLANVIVNPSLKPISIIFSIRSRDSL